MKKYRIIDSHCHVFPDKIAFKASKAIGDFYGMAMRNEGDIKSLLKSGKKIDVEKYIIHSTATKVEQVKSINDFISESIEKYNCLIGYGTLHQGMDKASIKNEVDRLIMLGLRGIKLHPDFQGFNIDDESAMKIYEVCEGIIPILIHVGDNRSDASSPTRLSNVLNKYPNLIVIAAHLGGYRRWDEAMKCIIGKNNLYIDTCSSLAFIDKKKAVEIIRAHGYERVLFAVDYPMWDHEEEFARFNALELSEQEKEAILYDNTAKLLNIK